VAALIAAQRDEHQIPHATSCRAAHHRPVLDPVKVVPPRAIRPNGSSTWTGRIGVTPEELRQWADGLRADDQVALEATGNSDAIANLLVPLVARVVVSNPSKTRAIAEARVKTDKVDARILAQLRAADFLLPVWLPDERTRCLRRQVTRRAHIVRQRTRIKNQVHAILARNLAPTPPVEFVSQRPPDG
jgi:transposase